MATKTVNIHNINCGHCTSTIEREVGEIEGVTSVKADKDSKTVTIEFYGTQKSFLFFTKKVKLGEF